ncbi:MAG TPA: ABC transporter permease [Phycisphaerales bacterium]|nr:ABC transporter permease [Phycisphaerales bacterium]
MAEPGAKEHQGLIRGTVINLGASTLDTLDHIGVLWNLLADMCGWIFRAMTRQKVRLGRAAIVAQMVRVGVQSVFIVALVSGSIGFILGFQMAPPLDNLGQKELVPNIIAVAVLRELGPLVAAIVLIGFAGASIAAEIGTMVVGEEVEALEAHALNPVRFLVVPRVLATIASLICLSVLSDLVAVFAAALMCKTVLDVSWTTYYINTLSQVGPRDFLTGLVKAGIFGGLIGLIACGNGLKVTGGAAGVGKATTNTVVESVVAVIFADLIFTVIFYALKLF